jgi:hypothetical protein
MANNQAKIMPLHEHGRPQGYPTHDGIRVPQGKTRFEPRTTDHYWLCSCEKNGIVCGHWCVKPEKKIKHEKRFKGHVMVRVELGIYDSLPARRENA